MGVLRLSLAMMVLYVHLQLRDDASVGVGPVMAVKAFYVLSGFYMTLILTGPYRGRPRRVFYANRALRLFPTHLLVMATSVLLVVYFAPAPLELSGFVRLDRWPALLADPGRYPLAGAIAVLNAGIVGIHALHFGCLDLAAGTIALVDGRGACASGVTMLDFTPNPPLWTLSIELLFYLAAPWLVWRSARVLLLLMALSLAARAALAALGYDQIPWIRTLFVLEVAYFLLGILAFRLHVRTRGREIPGPVLTLVCGGFLALSWGFHLLAGPLDYRPGAPGLLGWAYVLALAGLVPLLFRWSSGSRLDQWIGELAYPAYICHLLALGIVGAYGGAPLRAALGSEAAWIAGNVLATLGLSAGCLLLVGRPVERLRARIRGGARP